MQRLFDNTAVSAAAANVVAVAATHMILANKTETRLPKEGRKVEKNLDIPDSFHA